MLRIDKEANGREVILRISGRIDSAHLQMLKSELQSSPHITATRWTWTDYDSWIGTRFGFSAFASRVESKSTIVFPTFARWILGRLAYEPGQYSEDG